MNKLFDKLVSDRHISEETSLLGLLETQVMIEHYKRNFEIFEASDDHYEFIRELSEIHTASFMIKDYRGIISYYYMYKNLYRARNILTSSMKSIDILYVLYMAVVYPYKVAMNEFRLTSEKSMYALTFQFDINRKYKFESEHMCTGIQTLLSSMEYDDQTMMYLIEMVYEDDYDENENERILLPDMIISEETEDLVFDPSIIKLVIT